MGKARQAAKTEMEKLKLADMTCLELIKEAAKMYVFLFKTFLIYQFLFICSLFLKIFFSVYIVHDEVKDKHFELELSWVGEVTGGRHQKVPQEVYAEAERYAKSALEEDSDSGNEDM